MKVLSQTVLNKQVILVTLLVLGLICSSSFGQYELSWYTVDGGGGRSSGGPYELLSTIGQPDAAYSAGGDYELLGGFLPGGPLCFVNFEHFARFAGQWWLTGTGLPADLYEDLDNEVNWLDLGVFVEEWLCYCPAGWPLK
ncbi:MAG: hypothetical protein FVQ85_03170 [Planctomycetes bacterium]|nr:hypothetical protein [Planctomycetota bacterium]